MAASTELDHRVFAASPLFVGLEDSETERLLELARVHRVAPESVVVREGEMGDSLFVLHAGGLDVVMEDADGKRVPLAALLDRGAFFGEMSLVDPGPRSATVLARTDTVLLELSLEALEAFFEGFPETRVVILRNIARVLARRLRSANVRVALGASS